VNELPGPRATPVLGWPANVLRFFHDPIAYIDPWAAPSATTTGTTTSSAPAASRLVSFCQGMPRGIFRQQSPGAVIALGPDANQALLSQSDTYHGVALEGPQESASFARLVSGIFGMNGAHHRAQRRLLLPAFHRKYIESAHHTIVDWTEQTLTTRLQGQTVDVLPLMQELTLRIAANLLFGLSEGRESVTLARRMRELAEGDQPVFWPEEFLFRRGAQTDDVEESISNQLKNLPRRAAPEDYQRIARATIETADYGRGAEDGFRVLLESAGALVGTGSYRYLTAGPDLLAALVGALSADMPMASRDFFAAVRREWGLVINQEAASGTAIGALLDGANLERNSRRAEKLMSDAGLALGLSDRTTVVGERAGRRPV
jgi:hypothetical protein